MSTAAGAARALLISDPVMLPVPPRHVRWRPSAFGVGLAELCKPPHKTNDIPIAPFMLGTGAQAGVMSALQADVQQGEVLQLTLCKLVFLPHHPRMPRELATFTQRKRIWIAAVPAPAWVLLPPVLSENRNI